MLRRADEESALFYLPVAKLFGHDDEVAGLGEVFCHLRRQLFLAGNVVSEFLVNARQLLAQMNDAEVHELAA